MMNTSQLTVWIISLMLLLGTTNACNIRDKPCGPSQCCQLVFNVGLLSFSYCRNRNLNSSRCAQTDYCLRPDDCKSNQCDNASTFRWGRCLPANPCLKNVLRRLHSSS